MFGRRKASLLNTENQRSDEVNTADAHLHEELPSELQWEEVPSQPDEPPAAPVSDTENAADSVIFVGDNCFDLREFPALRMAFSEPQPQNDPSSLLPEEYIAESDGEDGITRLILRHAELAEQEESQPAPPQEDLPELFRHAVDDAAEELSGPPEDTEVETPDEEFTMEAELEKQREISGELFGYIDTINIESAERMRRREADRAAERVKPYDPYNVHFNSRFYDREEVLESTPEIELAPKYRLTDGWEE